MPAPPPQAGELRERVTVQQITRTKNAFGEGAETEDEWTDLYANVPAKVFNTQEYLVRSDAQVQMHVVYEVTMRWLPGATSEWRLLWTDREGVVHRLYLDGTHDLFNRGRWLILHCQERAEAGPDEG